MRLNSITYRISKLVGGLAALSCGVKLLADPPIELTIKVQSWTSDCADVTPQTTNLDCSTPKADGLAQVYKIPFPQLLSPGQADVIKRPFDLVGTQHKGEMRLYYAWPLPERNLPRYFQLQIESHAPIRTLCMNSVAERVPLLAPPLICAGYDSVAKKRWGLTIEYLATENSPLAPIVATPNPK